MLTSVGHWREVRHMQGASIDACLVKPVRQSQLQNTLATAWSKKLQSGFATRAKAPPEIAAVRSKVAARFAGAPVRVLVAEDNVVNQKVAVRNDHSQSTKRARLSRETERFRLKWQSAARVCRQSGCRKSGESGSFREYWPIPPGLDRKSVV